MGIHTFFLLFVHMLNTQLYSMYSKKNSVSQFFFHSLTKFFFGCIIDMQKKKNEKRSDILMLFLTNIVDVRVLCV